MEVRNDIPPKGPVRPRATRTESWQRRCVAVTYPESKRQRSDKRSEDRRVVLGAESPSVLGEATPRRERSGGEARPGVGIGTLCVLSESGYEMRPTRGGPRKDLVLATLDPFGAEI